MKVIRDFSSSTTKNIPNAVLTIGTFDGVHCGHQSIVNRVNDIAKTVKGESVLITFHPHPRTIINTGRQVELLSTMKEKIDLLEQYGLQNLVIVPFNRAFSEMSPAQYVDEFLINNFKLNTVVIGYNHKFGRNRAGDINFLLEKAQEHKFSVEEISKKQIEEVSVSSTKIRGLLREGKVKSAISLLGHEYFLRGTVVKGEQLGRKIGFPTANILVEAKDKLIPCNGVYAVRVKANGKRYMGMLNIGNRPTVSGNDCTIEVNIFDFDEDIYGEQLELNFVDLLRNEKKFEDLEGLQEQLGKDKAAAIAMLSS